MPEQARPAHEDEREANRVEHEAIMARIDEFLEFSRAEFAANHAEHEAFREELAANRKEHEVNRKEHEVIREEFVTNRMEHAELREMMAKLGVEMTKLGVEFEQHRNDTKVLADGILGLVRKTTALEGADAVLGCRVTRLEVRVASLVPKGRG